MKYEVTAQVVVSVVAIANVVVSIGGSSHAGEIIIAESPVDALTFIIGISYQF